MLVDVVIPSRSLLELLLLPFSLSMLSLAASTKGTHSRGGGLVTYSFQFELFSFPFLPSSYCWLPSCTEFAESTAFLKDPKFARDRTRLALFSPETMIVHLPLIGRTIFTGPQSACRWSSPYATSPYLGGGGLGGGVPSVSTSFIV